MLRSRHRRFLWRVALTSASRLHAATFRATHGRIGGAAGGLPILLLTTTGRKTGKQRTTPLLFIRDGDDIVVVASNGGMDWFPAWWLNLQSDPAAVIQIGGERRAVTATKADPQRRAQLWPKLTGPYPAYLKYEARTAREIPLVILHPDPH
jgi:deazaflavin-dependent oxidoreductase (nitroreductase family)